MIFDRFANLKYMAIGIFGAGATTLIQSVKNAKKIEEYIKNQLQDDIATDQISIKEYMDPFTGEQVKKSK